MRENKLNTFAQIRDLRSPKDMLFCCALLQRMLPNYQLFSQVSNFGDGQTAQSILNLLWEWCMSPQSKFNASVQLEKLEEIIPEVSEFDTFGVYPALDFCMALSSALQSFSKEHEFPAVTIAKLSQGSVEAYILATEDDEISNEAIKAHPLMEFEIETQLSLLEFCQNNKVNKDVCKGLREDLLAQKISSLGIELE
ncbi:YjaG family protein [Glaciecola sp. 2405UD65-10]|uniref:YjaG family protein n=1 Tax=Glaciecola sp. 2405UD65-10 TaxID=3397244 RepID=UPI003B5A849D